MNKNELINITSLVKNLLEKEESTRNSDSLLYLRVLAIFAAKLGINLSCISVPVFLLNSKELQFPSYETVSRARRKMQEKNPELRGDKKVQEKRRENEIEFKAYARSEAV